MNRLALTTVLFSLTVAATAQTGRSMRLAAPAVLGHTARFEPRHPTPAPAPRPVVLPPPSLGSPLYSS